MNTIVLGSLKYAVNYVYVEYISATPSAPVEVSEGDLAQGKSCQAVEISRRCVDP